jgi:hypothetical protein
MSGKARRSYMGFVLWAFSTILRSASWGGDIKEHVYNRLIDFLPEAQKSTG